MGLRSYFRLLLGLAFLLVGTAAVLSRSPRAGSACYWSSVVCSPSSKGFSVGYEGLESGFQDVVEVAFQVVVLAFIVGLLIVSRRAREPSTSAAST